MGASSNSVRVLPSNRAAESDTAYSSTLLSNLRRQNRKAHELLKEKVEEAVEWSQKGEKAAKTASAFQWAIDIAKGRPWSKEELVLIQLELSLAAIHNTTVSIPFSR